MSLRVWLPLTKDLRNQGLDDVTVTNNGATFNSAGKLGGCYSFGPGNSYITVDSTPLKTFTEFSFACWVKIISWNTSYSTIFAAKNSTGVSWNNLIFSLLRNSSNSTLCFNIAGSSGYTSTSCQTGTLSLNTWYHIACTYKSGQIKLYQDGSVVSTHNTSVVPSFSSIVNLWIGKSNENSYQSNNLLNDVRIYDHCLSPMEVKELAKGLVLHYPLNRQGFGQENLASQYIMPGGNKPGTTATNGRTNYYGDYGISIPATENADTYFSIWYSEPLESGATYTLSAEVSGLLSGSYYSFHLFAQDNTSMGIIKFNHNGLNTLTFTMNYTGTITTTTYNGKTYYRMFMDDVGRVIASGQGTITIKNIKLEKGSIATPWCPNSSDALATTMGLNGTTEYDTSGYCNNGTRTGTFSWTSDTPKYQVSTKFNGSECILRDSPNADIYTLTCWAKTSKSKNTAQFMVADSNSKLSISFYGGNIISYFYGNSAGTGSKCILGTEYKENEWNFFAVVKTGENTRDCYCNGVKLTPTSNDWWSTTTGFFVGNRSSGGNGPFYGEICDVRAYATALSADDVKSLYQNSAYIDSSGNVYGTIHES